MGFEDCYQLGYVQKTHGLQGGVSLFIDADLPETYKNLESVLLNQSGQLVPFFISELSIRGNSAIAKFEDIASIEDAKNLTGLELWLPLDRLPPLKADQYYYHELPGFAVIDGDQTIGSVANVHQMPNCDLLAVDYRGTEILIPIQEEIILKVNKTNKEIHVKLPEGLIDVYLDDHAD